MLIEVLAIFPDGADAGEEERHRNWAPPHPGGVCEGLACGYPNLLGSSETDRADASYGGNAARLVRTKRHYDPDNVFCSAIPLPPLTVSDRGETGLCRQVGGPHSAAAGAHAVTG